ncbi:AMP-dependent synthetase and ligase [Rhodomicrobium vannielii ATCC 17100]|uniref:AMP-dependent synthetase and ligase n=1 Tax=Rhodomicrobium vannielii (strain ATCC 17100 / DSM 162 / LMG 4299 / NCIMB 10020 / ATH 3.1.1) TaxID=648757 RepID=E3I0P9_RHOVT|nr:hypothetical protein [Rhodomicrobium vannielii]ADP71139.1 AMP-dependent synthetase and ligase [Rhodomicrobium vannielii ATCC 17100]
MGTVLTWFLGRLTAWGLGNVATLLSAGLSNFLGPAANALLALLKGFVSIIVDLSKKLRGALLAWGGRCRHSRVVRSPRLVDRADFSGLQAQVQTLPKRPAVALQRNR